MFKPKTPTYEWKANTGKNYLKQYTDKKGVGHYPNGCWLKIYLPENYWGVRTEVCFYFITFYYYNFYYFRKGLIVGKARYSIFYAVPSLFLHL